MDDSSRGHVSTKSPTVVSPPLGSATGKAAAVGEIPTVTISAPTGHGSAGFATGKLEAETADDDDETA